MSGFGFSYRARYVSEFLFFSGTGMLFVRFFEGISTFLFFWSRIPAVLYCLENLRSGFNFFGDVGPDPRSIVFWLHHHRAGCASFWFCRCEMVEKKTDPSFLLGSGSARVQVVVARKKIFLFTLSLPRRGGGFAGRE